MAAKKRKKRSSGSKERIIETHDFSITRIIRLLLYGTIIFLIVYGYKLYSEGLLWVRLKPLLMDLLDQITISLAFLYALMLNSPKESFIGLVITFIIFYIGFCRRNQEVIKTEKDNQRERKRQVEL